MPVTYESNVVVGNVEDKANLKNPISKWLVQNFDNTLFDFLQTANPASIHEVGCGEGRLTSMIADRYNIPLRATEFSAAITAELNAKNSYQNITYDQKSIYDLTLNIDHADTIICCEVLEHLEFPEKALETLKSLNANYYILSVPNEPVWCILNMVRGKYLSSFGNTPGHIQHWSKKSFVNFLTQRGFKIFTSKVTLPWTMVIGTFKK